MILAMIAVLVAGMMLFLIVVAWQPIAATASAARFQAPPPNRADNISIEVLADPALIVMGSDCLAANRAARQLFGDRVVGRDIRLTVRHPVLLDALDDALAHDISLEREITGLGGASTSWRVRVASDRDGKVLIAFDDISQARATERMRVDFVANASHELRTPLATLSGFIETLQGAAADDEPARQRFLSIMSDEARRMSRLIGDLLSLSRIELDKYIRPTDVLSLAGLADEVGRTMAHRFEADQRTLMIEEADDLPLVIGDRDQIVQVLHNLMSNALKYGQTGTPVTVVLAPEAAAVRISVADVGDGIAPEHLPRLTERFYRVDSQRSRRMGGTGLGLAIVKHIVERHRSRLEIDSRLGEGTRFSFTLPKAGG